MIISDEKKLKDIQREFQEKFPFLKLEFYSEEHAAGEGSADKQKLDPEKTIGDVRKTHTAGDISINGHLKVKTLEEKFHDIYGLNAQIFRKSSGDVWLQTITTDDWTLTAQNDRAAAYLTTNQS